MGELRATDVGVEPMMRVSPADYAALARDNDVYEVAAARIARRRAQAPAVRALAATLERDHGHALSSRPVGGSAAARALRLQFARALRTLDAAPPARFDAIYVQQVLDAHRHAWALHAGFAVDGRDVGLKARARTDLATEENHLRRLPLRPMRY